MRFSDVIGNDKLKSALAKMVDTNRLSHAILLNEEDGGGGMAMALALAQYVNCPERAGEDSCGECRSCHLYSKLTHPDLHFAFPVSKADSLSESEKKAPISDYFLTSFRELFLSNPYFTEQQLYEALGVEDKNSSISVAEARSIFDKLSLKASSGQYKTMVVYLPERMNIEAANKLLKLLEEPPEGTLFLLVSHNPERLLQTIRSRCQLISLLPLSREERASVPRQAVGNPEWREVMISILEAGLSKKLIDTFPQWEMLAEMGREKQKDFCIYAEDFIRQIYMTAAGMDAIAGVLPEEEATIRSLAARIKPSFYEKAYMQIEGTLSAIGSNVNAKLNFCDLCNHLLLFL